MKDNKPIDFLDPLNNVAKVDVPPYLFTRIEQRIKNVKEESLSPKITWAIFASLGLLVILNLSIITKHATYSQNNLVETFQLSTNNELYQ